MNLHNNHEAFRLLQSHFLPSDVSVFYHSLQREPVPDDYAHVDPEHKLIYRFVRTLFSAAQLTAECAIVTLVGRKWA